MSTGKGEPSSSAEEEKPYITVENKSFYQQAIDCLSQGNIEDDLLPIFIPLLHPHSRWELFLEMEEPSIDDLTSLAPPPTPASEGTNPQEKKLSWIEWYDTLKEYAEVIRKELLSS